jgi:hypothetical protein
MASLVAITDAVRGDSNISEISPKMSPGGFRVDLDLGASAIAKHVECARVHEVHLGSHVALLDHALVRRDFQHGHLPGHGVAHGLCELVEDHRVLEGGFDEVDLVVVRLAPRGGFGLGGCAPRGSHVEPLRHALRTELGHLLVVAVLADAHDALRGGPLSLGRVRRAVAPIGPAGGVGVGANLGFVLLVLLVLRLGRAAELVRLAVIHRLFTQARTHRDATIGLASLVDSREGGVAFRPENVGFILGRMRKGAVERACLDRWGASVALGGDAARVGIPTGRFG